MVILVGAISYFFDSLLGDSFPQGLIAQHVLLLADGRTVHFYRAGPPESVVADVGATWAAVAGWPATGPE